MRFWGIIRLIVVLAIILLSGLNASWIAPTPPGTLRLIAAKADVGEPAKCLSSDSANKAFINGADFLVLSPQDVAECKFSPAMLPRRKFILAEEGGFATASATPWHWKTRDARLCFDDYVRTGWLGMVPESCRGKTMVIPLEGQWKVWGWPKRFHARMDAAGVRVILGEPGAGIQKHPQIPDVPRDFKGYLWVEDIGRIGPLIRR
jgi:hypothetical protein